MDVLIDPRAGTVDLVLHPTDLSEASLVAFHHALAVGMRAGSQLTLLHAVGRRATDSWTEFPSVRDTLARWRSAGTTHAFEDAVRRASVAKIDVPIPDPVAACRDYLRRNAVDLIVLATQGRRGLTRLLGAPRAERLAREAERTTLFVPSDARPFVSAETGNVRLRTVLLPVAATTDARPAMVFAARMAALLDDPSLEITLLHVGEGDDARVADLPDLPYCRWTAVRRSGDPAERILEVAREIDADVICMSASWSAGRRDGAVTEAVLRAAPCPLVAVPAAPS